MIFMRYLENKLIKRKIYIKNKLINLIIKCLKKFLLFYYLFIQCGYNSVYKNSSIKTLK